MKNENPLGYKPMNYEFFSLVELLSEEKEAAVKYQSIPDRVMSIIKL